MAEEVITTNMSALAYRKVDKNKKSYDGYAIRPEPWNDKVSVFMAPSCGPGRTIEDMEKMIVQDQKATLYNIYKGEKQIGSTIVAIGEHKGEKEMVSVATGGERGLGMIALLDDFWNDLLIENGFKSMRAGVLEPAIGKVIEEIGAKLEEHDPITGMYTYRKYAHQ